jgi:predicted dehydrogenase
MRVAIVGCGLIGNKRAKALGDAKLVATADTNLVRAQQLAGQHPGCIPSTDWRDIIASDDVDVVVASTTNDQLAAITLAAVKNGKHVLVEKPAALNAGELEPVAAAAREAFERRGVVVKVGFNHRFHPALLKAGEIVASGALGPMTSPPSASPGTASMPSASTSSPIQRTPAESGT